MNGANTEAETAWVNELQWGHGIEGESVGCNRCQRILGEPQGEFSFLYELPV